MLSIITLLIPERLHLKDSLISYTLAQICYLVARQDLWRAIEHMRCLAIAQVKKMDVVEALDQGGVKLLTKQHPDVLDGNGILGYTRTCDVNVCHLGSELAGI